MPKTLSLKLETDEQLQNALAQPLSLPRKRVRPAYEPPHEWYKEYTTPQKAKVQGTIEYFEAKNIPHHKTDVFKHFRASKSSGYEILAEGSSAQRIDILVENNPSHRTRKITPQKLREMERILENKGIEARGLTWEQLGTKVGLNVSGKTVQRALGTLEYHKFIACKKGWVNKQTAAKRVEHACIMLKRYSDPEDWYKVRFSDEVHFG
jgi:transposase